MKIVQKMLLMLISCAFALHANGNPIPVPGPVDNGRMNPTNSKIVIGDPVSKRSKAAPVIRPLQETPKNVMADVRNSRKTYTMSELADMSYQEAIDAIVALSKSEEDPRIDDSYVNNAGTRAFFLDANRMTYMFNDLKNRAATVTSTDHKGVALLAEVLRCGPYHGFSVPEFKHLNEISYKKANFGPAIIALAGRLNSMGLPAYNAEFDYYNPDPRLIMLKGMGRMFNVGVPSPDVFNSIVPIANQFNSNFANYDFNKYESMSNQIQNALFDAIGAGADYSLNVDMYDNDNVGYYDWTKLSLYNKITPFYNAMVTLALQPGGETLDDPKDSFWIRTLGVYQVAHLGRAIPKPTQLNDLHSILVKYHAESQPYLEALRMIDYIYPGEVKGKDGEVMTEEKMKKIKEDLKTKLFTGKYNLDGGQLKFFVGTTVPSDSVAMLYWAVKEVKSQFLRLCRKDVINEPEMGDSVMTAYVFATLADYKTYQTFLHGYDSNNGGMYIPAEATFYTYERTKEESTFRLEELFRHEYVHYLQSAFMQLGKWGDGGSMYGNGRLDANGEGGAEFFAGSTRLDGVKPRKVMLGYTSNTNESDFFDLKRTLFATYASEMFNMYGPNWAWYSYMYMHRIDLLLKTAQLIQDNDAAGYDAFKSELVKTESENYKKHVAWLHANSDKLTNPKVEANYFANMLVIQNQTIINKITSLSGISSVAAKVLDNINLVDNSNMFRTLRVRGSYTAPTASQGQVEDWKVMNAKINEILVGLDKESSWAGFKTFTGHFVDYKVEGGKAQFTLVFSGRASEGVALDENELTTSLTLEQNYPNPFNPETSIKFTLPQAENVKLSVFNIKGELVNQLVNNQLAAGKHEVKFSGASLTSGVYFYKLQTPNKTEMKKMMLLK